MRHLLAAPRVVTPDEELAPGWVLIRDGTIEGAGGGEGPDGDPRTELAGVTLAPGFIDIHVHGGGGFSLLSGDAREAAEYRRWAATRGVTALLPTVCAASPEEAVPLLETLSALCGDADGGAELLGVNLEGPFVSTRRLGALPATWAHAPDEQMMNRLAQAAARSLRLITVAPELNGAASLIATARKLGVTISIGHSDAGFEVAAEGFRAGASHVTHALNAMRPFHQRDPGIVGAALEAAGATVELIADGVHLHPSTVRLLVSAFGARRVALITDGVTPAGLSEGMFRIGSQEAVLTEGRVTLPDRTIAGSAATMDTVVRNVVDWGIASLPDAVRMASTVPAIVAGAVARKGRIMPGYDADLLALTSDLEVAASWVRGRIVYSSPGFAPAT